MNRRFRLLCVGVFAGALLAPIARADVPSPANSTMPAFVEVGLYFVGGPGQTVAPLAGAINQRPYSVIVRNIVNNPIPGVRVRLDFSQCFDIRLCMTLVDGQTTVCPDKYIEAITDVTGTATFRIAGAASFGPPPLPQCVPGSGPGCVKITLDGIQGASVTATALDLTGASGLTGQDMSNLVLDVGCYGLFAQYHGRSDFQGNGAINGGDISVFIPRLGECGLPPGCASCSAYCP